MAKVTHEQLAALGRDERIRLLEAVEASAGAGARASATSVETRLAGFEARFGMSTAEMQRRVAAGSLFEDEEIAAWLFWAHAARRARGGR